MSHERTPETPRSAIERLYFLAGTEPATREEIDAAIDEAKAQVLRDAADALSEYGNTMTAARGHLELIAARLEAS